MVKPDQQSIDTLRDELKPGTRLFTLTVHTSTSGMSRAIDVFHIRNTEHGGEDGPRPWRISWMMAKAGACSYDNRYEACKATGVGMDMGFHLVYNLSRILYPDGFGCIGEGCPSNDHSNGDRDYTPHVQRLPDWDYANSRHTDTLVPTVVGPGHWHEDGGYALRHEWLR